MTGKTQSNTLRHKRQSGFTLILSLFLLAILASLGVAFGLLVVLETKASYHKRHVIRARENAKTALNQALQKIQEEAGPDQRVTARAEIWANGSADPDPQPATSSQVAKIQGKNIGRQYYTGVWNSKMANSTPSWLVSSQPKSGGDKDHFTHPSYLHRSNYPLSTDLESDPDFVKMVSGSQKDYEDNRKNRLLTPDDSLWLWKSAVQEGQRGSDPKMYRSSGHFAWWAGDEGIKARVNLGFGKIDDWVNKPIATNELQFKKVTPFTAAHNYGFEGIGGLSNLFDFKDELESIPTLHSLIPMEAATSKQVRKIFHDASASNRGVIADVKHGGLKKDLTAALFNDIEFGRFLQGQSRFQDTTQGNLSRKNPDRIFDPLLRASEPGLTGRKTGENPGGPKWEQLRSFTRLYDIVNPSGTAYDTTDDFIPIRDHNDNQHGIAPILTRLQIFFTASYEDTGIDKPCGIPGGGSELKRLYRLQFHVL
ncbi:MAG: type II secretion system protein, partial [Opitutae bacterium]|nr:type II secretion system protein [Opitutae bacterium]